ncbi:MAG TPA: hypothetical protein VL461_03160 [Dictyobacter sp.]|nr:hypothetical protein [Dictyobacter sp.]
MSDMFRLTSPFRKQKIELTTEERAQLNVIIDLLIPSDKDFPPPSSLQLIDDFLHHLLPKANYRATLLLNEKRLRSVLHELNISAGGSFCRIEETTQQKLLKHLEFRDPATFQALWTLANHSYYTLLATRLRPQLA